MSQAVKCFSSKPEDLSLICQNPHLKKNQAQWHVPIISALRKQRQEEPQGLLARESNKNWRTPGSTREAASKTTWRGAGSGSGNKSAYISYRGPEDGSKHSKTWQLLVILAWQCLVPSAGLRRHLLACGQTQTNSKINKWRAMIMETI